MPWHRDPWHGSAEDEAPRYINQRHRACQGAGSSTRYPCLLAPPDIPDTHGEAQLSFLQDLSNILPSKHHPRPCVPVQGRQPRLECS